MEIKRDIKMNEGINNRSGSSPLNHGKEGLLPDKAGLKKSIDNYFNGTADREEIKILLEAANKIADSGSHYGDCQELAEDLLTILSIEEWGKAALSALEVKVPADLEKQLDEHISELAKKDRLRVRLRWIAAISSAAAVAVIFSIVAYLSATHDESLFNPNDKTNISLISDGAGIVSDGVVPADSGNNHNIGVFPPEVSPLSESSVGGKALASAESSLSNVPNSTTRGKKGALAVAPRKTSSKPVFDKEGNNRAFESDGYIPEPAKEQGITAATTATVDIPVALSPIEEIMPRIANATVNPSQLVIQPFTTLTQVFDNVYESISTVGVALSGVNDSFNAATNELNKMGSTQLRAI